MPLYEYRCVKCGRKTEKIEKYDGPHLKKCPHCGAKVEPMFSAPAIQFKGTGWYVTDYARKGSGGDAGKGDGNKSESGKSDGAKSDSATSSAKTDSSEKPAKESKKKAGPAPKGS